MEIKCILFDVDKTLYDHKTETYIKSSLEAIKTLRKKGILVYIVTSRSIDSLEHLNFSKNVEYDGIYSYNGAVFTKEKKTYAKRFLDTKTVQKSIELAKKHNFCIEIITLDSGYLGSPSTKLFENYCLNFKEKKYDYKEYQNEAVTGIVYFLKKEDEHLINIFDGFYNRYGEEVVELTNIENKKSEAVIDVMKKHNLNKENIMCFGDSFFDESMFIECGYPIAMGNGTEKIKSLAFDVTDDIDKDGVVKALKKYNLI